MARKDNSNSNIVQKRTFKSVVKTLISLLNAKRFLKQRIKRITLSVLVLGAANTGKTSIIKAICGEDFEETYTPTVLDFYDKETLVGNSNVKFEFVDISGSYSFPAMRKLYIEKSDIFFLVYDKRQKTYDELLRLKAEIEQVRRKHITELPVAVIKTKCDSRHRLRERNELDEEISHWCGASFHCSGKTSFNISEIEDYLLSEGLFVDSPPISPIERNSNRRLSGRYIYGGRRRSKSLLLNRRSTLFPAMD